MSSGEASKGKKSSSDQSSQQTTLPSWLQPYVQATAGHGANAVQNIANLVSGGNFVAGFDPAQAQGQRQALDVAQGAGGFIPTAQNTMMNAAQGQGLNAFMPQGAYNAVSGAASGSAPLNAQQQAGYAGLQQAQSGAAAPQWATDVMRQNATASSMPGEARDALSATARGDYLYGGDAQNAALDAAQRRIMPQVMSQFHRGGGVGAATGGLAKIGMAQALGDSFAGLYDSERNRQMGAAGQLGQFGLAQQGNNLNAANMGAGYGMQGAQLGLNASNALSGFGQQNQANQLQAGMGLLGMGQQERMNQLNAAQMLPGMGMLSSDIMRGVGAERQALEQQRLTAPLTANQMLAQTAYGAIPAWQSLFGQDRQAQSDEIESNVGIGWG